MTLEDPLVQITVTIPQSRARDLLTFAAGLHSAAADTPAPAAPTMPEARIEDGQGVARDALLIAGPGSTTSAVTRSYTGGDSEYWRPFLQLLANRPENWVHWPELYEELGLKNLEAAGMWGGRRAAV
jgi:hypothetical protein